MDDKQLLDLVAEIVEVEPGSVSMADELEAIGWDSLSNITFIAEVDDAVGVTLDADELADAATVADLSALVSAGKAD